MKNEIGKRYGKLTVIAFDHSDSKRGAHWLCACDCGCTVVVKGSSLRSGKTKSCGCLKIAVQKNLGNATREQTSKRMREFNKTPEHRAQARKAATKHGGTGTRLFEIWSGMRDRCKPNTDKEHKRWYYDKGIRVCDEWQDFAVFREWAYANGYKEDSKDTPLKERMSIDRIDPTRGYSPDNCRWITFSQNMIYRNQYYADQRRRQEPAATHSR